MRRMIFHCVVVLCALVSAWAENEGEQAKALRGDAVRVIRLTGMYMDAPTSGEPDATALLLGRFERPHSFPALCDKIDEIAAGAQFKGVFFDLSDSSLHLNLAQISELSRRIAALRETGKKAVAWIENADTAHYAVAAACDAIVMADMGLLDFPSLSLSVLHFYDAMERLGVRASFVRTGKFKGAVEPFAQSKMSDELRAHYREMLGEMNRGLAESIARSRNREIETVREWQRRRLFSGKAAIEEGMVDRLAGFGEERGVAKEFFGGEVEWVEAKRTQPKPLSFFELMGKLMAGPQARPARKPAIAVLHLNGQIVDGRESAPGLVASEATAKAIEQLAGDSQVKGVVVRINSPGGSATGSEVIRRALSKLSEKKPVIVSMGEMAASGGYWVACIGRPIYAERGTLTGSIGAFAMKLSFGGLMDKIGLGIESVAIDDSAMAMSMTREWTAEEKERIQGFVDDIYGRFLKLVSESRGLEQGTLNDLASGRVWCGAQAREHGLVDVIGGMNEAIDALAEETGLSADFEVIHRPEPKPLFDLLDLFDERGEEISLLRRAFAEVGFSGAGIDLRPLIQLVRAAGMNGGQAHIWLINPAHIEIH